MTKEEALKLALERLKEWVDHSDCPDDKQAITAIKEVLAQPEHGWTPERIAGMARLKDAQDKRLAQPEQDWIERERAVGYREGHRAALAQRTWVGLTEKDILEAAVKSQEGISPRSDTLRFAEAIETKLKEKNNG